MSSVPETPNHQLLGEMAEAVGHCWLPVELLRSGMIVARPVVGEIKGRVSIMFGEGLGLTAETIAQLMVKGVECVAVVDENPLSDEELLQRQRAYEARLRVIFGVGDDSLQEHSLQALYEALLAMGPSR